MFAVGLNGQGGYRLQVSPGKGTLEIYKGDESVANVPYEWKSGEWTMLRLQITKSGAIWKVAGKAWTQGATEPGFARFAVAARRLSSSRGMGPVRSAR